MPVLSAALSSVAIDAGCAYLWALVHAGAAVTSDEATLLIEVSYLGPSKSQELTLSC